MSFFKKIFGFISSLGFVILLTGISFVLVSLIYVEKNNSINDHEIDIYLKNEIKEFIYNIEQNDLNIAVKFNSDKEEDYCLSYAYHYYDTYSYKINLTVENFNNYLFIIVINSKNSYLSKHTI